MRIFKFLAAAVCLGAVAVAGLLRGASGKDPEAVRIANLVKQLGADTFAEREAAGKALEAAGEKALPALVEAAAAGPDLEVRRRAQRLLRVIMPESRKSKATGMRLVRIHAGEFQMGSPAAEPNRRPDEPQHRVRITRPFFLGAYEVTQDEYRKVMKANPSWFSDKGGGNDLVHRVSTGQFPVEKVSWFDAVEFCNRLSKLDGIEPYYKVTGVKRDGGSITTAKVAVAGGNGYRLPTEAEWEYACRAGTTTPFHFGRENTGREANLKAMLVGSGYGMVPRFKELGRTAKVGSYPANVWGLYDVHGNVAEWCQDWYDKDYYAASPADDPKGPNKGYHRVLRGGSWLVNDGSSRAASRLMHVPAESKYYTGFRVARNP